MIFLKNYFVSTSKEIDFIPIIHDIRFCIRDSKIKEGLITLTLPEEGAFFLIDKEEDPQTLKTKETALRTDLRTLPLSFRANELILGPKQMIYLVDVGDSGKRREFYVQIFGETEKPAQPAGRGRRT